MAITWTDLDPDPVSGQCVPFYTASVYEELAAEIGKLWDLAQMEDETGIPESIGGVPYGKPAFSATAETHDVNHVYKFLYNAYQVVKTFCGVSAVFNVTRFKDDDWTAYSGPGSSGHATQLVEPTQRKSYTWKACVEALRTCVESLRYIEFNKIPTENAKVYKTWASPSQILLDPSLPQLEIADNSSWQPADWTPDFECPIDDIGDVTVQTSGASYIDNAMGSQPYVALFKAADDGDPISYAPADMPPYSWDPKAPISELDGALESDPDAPKWQYRQFGWWAQFYFYGSAHTITIDTAEFLVGERSYQRLDNDDIVKHDGEFDPPSDWGQFRVRLASITAAQYGTPAIYSHPNELPEGASEIESWSSSGMTLDASDGPDHADVEGAVTDTSKFVENVYMAGFSEIVPGANGLRVKDLIKPYRTMATPPYTRAVVSEGEDGESEAAAGTYDFPVASIGFNLHMAPEGNFVLHVRLEAPL